MTNPDQDALIPAPTVPGMRPNDLTIRTQAHLDHLRSLGLLKAEHELHAALVMHLATIAGATTKGYAAAQVFRELREAIAGLPVPEATPAAGATLAEQLEALGHGEILA